MISIIVLHHDKAAYSRACLQSLGRSSFRPLEVINIDNGSRDDTPAVLREWEPAAREAGIETRTLSFDTNIGAVRGRNEALRVARGTELVFLDNDTLVAQTDWLRHLRDFLRGDAVLSEDALQRGIVAPKLVFPWPPFAIECCGCGITRGGRVKYFERGQARHKPLAPRIVQCAISAAWMMTREAYESVGPLDEIYSPVQYEDLDWCYRARQKGFATWVLPSVEVFHFEHTTTAGSGDINFKYVTTKNGLTFKKRWQAVFHREDGPDESDAQWLSLEKRGIEEIDVESLSAD